MLSNTALTWILVFLIVAFFALVFSSALFCIFAANDRRDAKKFLQEAEEKAELWHNRNEMYRLSKTPPTLFDQEADDEAWDQQEDRHVRKTLDEWVDEVVLRHGKKTDPFDGDEMARKRWERENFRL